MSVLILKNIASEGPGTIEDFLREQDIGYTVVDMSSQEVPPPDGFDTLVMLGGPMSVNDTDLYPYISEEEELTRDFVGKGKKVFGICLGSQIMAKALGGKVYAGPKQEIGWLDIELVDVGIGDRVMGELAMRPDTGGFQKRFKVFHWHGETFDLPAGAERLARSDLYQNQAFKYGNTAYAFQFHIEVKEETIYAWMKDEDIDKEKLKEKTDEFYKECAARALNFYRAFFL